MSDILDRLRDPTRAWNRAETTPNLMTEAADYIAVLERENAELRAEVERMQPVVEIAVAITPPNGDGSEDDYDSLKSAVLAYKSGGKP